MDHQTKLVLVPEAIQFEDFINQVFQVIELDRDKFEAMIWFDINLGTSKEMLVSKDLDLHTYIDNEQALGIQVLESASVIEEVAEKTSTQLTRLSSNSKQTESPTTILRENASLDEIKVGSIFDKKKSIINCFSNIAIKGHFEFKVVRSSSTRYSLKCNNDRCGWCVRAFRIKDSTLFKIVKIEKNHDCSVNTMKVDQRHATSKLISSYIIDNLRDPRFEVTPAFVMAEMQKLHGLDIGYHKAWHAIQRASALIRGTPENNYELLSSYLYMMKSKNPGTYTNIIDDNNRHQSITHGITKVYPKSHHGICIYHLEKNLKRWKVKSEVIKLFQSAARVYSHKEFDLYMSDIERVDKKTFDYLMEEPLERWARSCSPRRRYDMLTINIVESMNYVLLEAREQPILRIMNFIQVFPVDSWRSRVEEEGITFLVDLNKRTSIEKRNIKKSNFCSNWYLKESWLKTYERQIHPVGHTDSWIVPESVKS
ncbi:uncharacterized protein [Nicotiana tomentosiformis]|uniref:uncharacterized protein n=1 Tax=Nicotiana tomentosiformis TaxID=4098 RepID=UPI00388C9C18